MILEEGKIKIDSFMVSAFVTENTPYEFLLSTQLLPSLEKLAIRHYIEVIENKGSWLKNVAQKPLTILHALEKFTPYNIVALDADCEVLSFPKLFNEIPEEYDIGVHILDWNSWYGNGSDIKETLSGTVWIKNNEKMREFVEEWYKKANISSVWEQKVLENLLKKRPDIKVFTLPIEYCYIETLPNGEQPIIQVNPIIVHHQASRKLKRQMNFFKKE